MRGGGANCAACRGRDSEHFTVAVQPRRRRKARAVRGHRRDWLTSLRKLRNGLCVAVQHRFACNAVVVCLERQMRAPGRCRDLWRQFALLRQTGHGNFDRSPRNLAALVEVEGAIFRAKDLLDPLLVVQARDPDLRPVRQLNIEIRLVEADAQGGETQFQHLGQRVGPDAGLGVVEAEAEYRVPAARRVDGALQDSADQQEGLARPRAAAEHDVAGR